MPPGRRARRGGGRPPPPTAQRSSDGARGRPPRGRAPRRTSRRPPRARARTSGRSPAPRTASGQPLLANDPHLLVQQPGGLDRAPPPRARLRGARGRGAVRSRGSSLGTTAHHAWGATNVCGRRAGPLPRATQRRRHGGALRGRVGAAHGPPRGDRGSAGARSRSSTRSARPGTARSSTPTSPAGSVPTKQPARRDLRAPVGRRRAQHPALRADRRRERHELRGVPRGRVARSIARARTSCTPTSTARSATSAPGSIRSDEPATAPPGPRVDGRARVGRLRPLRGAPVRGRPRPRLPRDGQRPDPRRRLPAPDRPRLPCARPRRPDHRAARGAADHTVETCRAIQSDTVSSRRAPRPADLDPQGRRSGAPRGWDHDLDARTRPAAALWEVLVDELARRAVDGKEPLVAEYLTDRELFRCRALPSAARRGQPRSQEQLDDALDAAWHRCVDAMGPDPSAWRWGDIHRARFAHPLGRHARPRAVVRRRRAPARRRRADREQRRVRGRRPLRRLRRPRRGGWSTTSRTSTPAEAILPTGQSGNPASPHWNDQTDAWAAGELRPLPFTRAAVEDAATERLTLVPA